MIDKEALIKTLITAIQDDIEMGRKILDATKSILIELPGVMQPEVDADRFEMARLAGKQSERLAEKQEVLACLQRYISSAGITSSTFVEIGSVFTIEDGINIDRYLLLPVGSGQTIDFEGYKYCILSPKSPLAVQLLSKKKGDKIKFKTDEERTVVIAHIM